MALSSEEIDEIIQGIYSGKITPESLPSNLYLDIAEKLKSGLYKGFGSSLKKTISEVGYGSAPADLLNNLRENIYLFAGAKTFQQTEEMRGLLVKDGKVIPFKEFDTLAKETYDRYNKTWIESEYITAIGQGENARLWAQIDAEKEVFPFIRYVAVMDANTSTICAPFNNLVLPVGDPFWAKYSPLNHYRCRCVLEKLEAEDAKVSSAEAVAKATGKVDAQMNSAFKINPGISGEVFGKGHPYYKVPDEYKDLAKNNFNLPIPDVGFRPAKNIAEVHDRILNSGVKKVDLRAMSLDNANAVLEAVETENKLSPLNLESIKTMNRPKGKAVADYSPSLREIRYNVGLKHRPYEPLKTFEERIAITKEKRDKVIKEYLGNPKYLQSSVRSNINAYNRAISELEYKIKSGETPKFWTISASELTEYDSVKRTVVHEIGHHRDFTLRRLKEKDPIVFSKRLAPTDYGQTDAEEYFAEFYAKYRKDGPDGIPADVLKVFEKIDSK